MNKALIVTSVASMVDQFLLPSIALLKDMGYTVEVACNFENGSTCSRERIDDLKNRLDALGVRYYQIDFARSVLHISQHLRAYKQIKAILSGGDYALMHCHSPIGGMLARLACRKARKQGTKVFYTAHGFHFYKGAPLKNWLLYYPVEKYCARLTDVLITINQEDYALAQKKLKAKRVEYVLGVGVDLTKFGQTTVDKAEKRKELGVPEDAILLLSVGELNKNKNHETVIRAVAELPETNVYYFIAGKGDLREHLQSVIDEAGLTERVKLLGYRSDVAELYRAADVCVFPSLREGLGLAAIEGMACGLPLLVSDNRGTREFCVDGVNGFVCSPLDVDAFSAALQKLITDQPLQKEMAEKNKEFVKKFSVAEVNKQLAEIYEKSVGEKLGKGKISAE